VSFFTDIEMVGGACDVAACGDLFGDNHHPTVGYAPGVDVDGALYTLSPSWPNFPSGSDWELPP
jgi:hypothetical protein